MEPGNETDSRMSLSPLFVPSMGFLVIELNYLTGCFSCLSRSSLSPPSTLGSTFSPTQTTPLGPRQYHTIGVARRGGGGGGGGAQRLAGMDTDLVGVLPSSYQFA